MFSDTRTSVTKLRQQGRKDYWSAFRRTEYRVIDETLIHLGTQEDYFTTFYDM